MRQIDKGAHDTVAIAAWNVERGTCSVATFKPSGSDLVCCGGTRNNQNMGHN